jgi:hypothetical protein
LTDVHVSRGLDDARIGAVIERGEVAVERLLKVRPVSAVPEQVWQAGDLREDSLWAKIVSRPSRMSGNPGLSSH